MVRAWVSTSGGRASRSLLVLGGGGPAHGAEPRRRSAEDAARARPSSASSRRVADYDAGRYDQALANFQEAFRLRPHPLVNVNIANCYDKLGKPLQAIFHFERFLEAEAGTPAQRAEVTSALERLRKQVGTAAAARSRPTARS